MNPSTPFRLHLVEILGPVLAASLLTGCATEERTVCQPVATDATCPTLEQARADLVGDLRCTHPQEEVVEVVAIGERLTGILDTGTTPHDACCYETRVRLMPGTSCVVGRPLETDQGPAVAPLERHRAWADAVAVDAEALSAEDRAAAGAWWLRTALEEHASVGAFARLALELLGHGAPSDLLLRAQLAGAEEVVHAREAFALAAALGAPGAPGPLPVPARDLPALSALAVESLVHGAVNETLAALLAAERLAAATEPAVRAALERVVADEARHAALGWDLVRWALAEGGPEVLQALASAPLACPQATPEAALVSHGLLGQARTQEALERAWARVVAPMVGDLLGRVPDAPVSWA